MRNACPETCRAASRFEFYCAAEKWNRVTSPVTTPGTIARHAGDFLLWTAKPPAPRKPTPAEHVWTMRKDGKQIDAELRSHGEWGWECQFYRDGSFLYGRRWQTRAATMSEIEEKRCALTRSGWIPVA